MTLRAVLAVLLLFASMPSEAQPAIKQVLMLQSLHRGNLVLDNFNGNFRVRLDQRAGKPVNVVQVTVGPTGFVGASDQATVDYIRSMYVGGQPPDLIVTAGGPAAVFARKHREELFPQAPLLFASVDQRFLRGAPLRENESAVTVINDFPRLVDDILQVLPGTRHVFMINGSGALGQFWRRELDTGFARFRDRVTFTWSDELSLEDILRRCASLPPNSAIVYLTFGTDATGGAYADEQVLAALRARANAPMFAAFTPLFGSGIVGGSLMSVTDLAGNAADIATRLLNGEPPGSLSTPPHLPGQAVFDWRELQRWGIPESRLPPGSAVQFRGPTLWDEFRPAALSVLGIVLLQALLITWLLYERRARRRAEVASRQNLALAADANRRETISTLATSISHELGQPLSAIVHNAQALRMMVDDNRTEPDATGEIVADIQSEAALATQIIDRHRTMLRSHQLQKKPVDVRSVIDESLALVAHDLRARQVVVSVDPSSTPCVVDADPVLLGQVLTNLFRNALESLAGVPPQGRRITIRTAATTGGVEITVADTGSGLPPEIIDTLFTPFVTTKPQGLGIGLPIAQRIVEAHGGTIAARENPGGGAMFTVTLPRARAGTAQ